MMMRRALLLLFLCAARCERDNPAYCDEAVPCADGRACLLPAHRCAPADEVAWSAADAAPIRCAGPKDCDKHNLCVAGTCYQPCGKDEDCADTPAGRLCTPGLLRRCGCASDADCPVAGTRCDPGAGLCRCGGAVCRKGQRCTADACER